MEESEIFSALQARAYVGRGQHPPDHVVFERRLVDEHIRPLAVSYQRFAWFGVARVHELERLGGPETAEVVESVVVVDADAAVVESVVESVVGADAKDKRDRKGVGAMLHGRARHACSYPPLQLTTRMALVRGPEWLDAETAHAQAANVPEGSQPSNTGLGTEHHQLGLFQGRRRARGAPTQELYQARHVVSVAVGDPHAAELCESFHRAGVSKHAHELAERALPALQEEVIVGHEGDLDEDPARTPVLGGLGRACAKKQDIGGDEVRCRCGAVGGVGFSSRFSSRFFSRFSSRFFSHFSSRFFRIHCACLCAFPFSFDASIPEEALPQVSSSRLVVGRHAVHVPFSFSFSFSFSPPPLAPSSIRRLDAEARIVSRSSSSASRSSSSSASRNSAALPHRIRSSSMDVIVLSDAYGTYTAPCVAAPIVIRNAPLRGCFPSAPSAPSAPPAPSERCMAPPVSRRYFHPYGAGNACGHSKCNRAAVSAVESNPSTPSFDSTFPTVGNTITRTESRSASSTSRATDPPPARTIVTATRLP